MAQRYPRSLPAPALSGYSTQPQDVAIRSQMDQGTPRVRRRFRRALDVVAARWSLTSSEYDVFRAWWTHELAAGTQWFESRLMVPGRLGTVVAFRFVGVYEAEFRRRWHVSASLEVDGFPTLTAAQLEAFM